MKIVIDIPEEDYIRLKEQRMFGRVDVFKNAVRDAVVLPKGHGDLIDRKELLRQPMDLANYPSNYVRIATTIIEADAESEVQDAYSN